MYWNIWSCWKFRSNRKCSLESKTNIGLKISNESKFQIDQKHPINRKHPINWKLWINWNAQLDRKLKWNEKFVVDLNIWNWPKSSNGSKTLIGSKISKGSKTTNTSKFNMDRTFWKEWKILMNLNLQGKREVWKD